MRKLSRLPASTRLTFLCMANALGLAMSALASDHPAIDFEEATKALEAGDTEAAIQMYSGLLEANWHAPELYHNLAVAYQRQGLPQQALLQSYRAWLLTPFSNAAQGGFESLTEAANLSSSRQRDAKRQTTALAWQSPLGWVALGAFWLGVLTLIFLRTAFARGLGVAAIAIGMVTGLATLWVHRQAPAANEAWIITADPAPLRASHGEASPQISTAPSLSPVNITAQRGDWVFVETPNGRSGWLARGQVALVRPWLKRDHAQ